MKLLPEGVLSWLDIAVEDRFWKWFWLNELSLNLLVLIKNDPDSASFFFHSNVEDIFSFSLGTAVEFAEV